MSANKGAMRVIQLQVNRPLQVIVCMIHMTESPFKHLLEKLDGGKIKWTATKGLMGTKIKNLNENLTPLVNFQPIPTNVPDVDSQIFAEASNRLRLHQLCVQISKGREHVLPKFETNQYPVICTTRWLTTSERILGWFIRELNPSDDLIIMVVFTLQAYGPTHFEIFLHPGFENSSFHYLNYIKKSKVNFVFIQNRLE